MKLVICENPDHWIIDEEAAEVVRRIYRMTIEGKGPYQIARELSEEKIERPSYYLGKKGLGNHASNYDKENPYMWRGNQVTTLIARPEYIGKTVNFRTFKNSYKDKKTKRADKEDWVVFDDTQEPIVDEETWLLAQKLRQNVRKADPMGEPNVLTGKIYCADCGAPMYNHRQRKGRERIYYTAKGEKRTSYSNPADCYECSTYNLAYQKYDRHCTCHHISRRKNSMTELKPRIHDESNGLDYVLVGDYYVPDLKLPEEHRPIGMWGRLHRTYLEQYRPARLSALCLSGELHTYLADLNEQAAERCSLIIEQMKQAEGVTETMKADNQMLWVQSINSIRNRAEEIIRQEMIYC